MTHDKPITPARLQTMIDKLRDRYGRPPVDPVMEALEEAIADGLEGAAEYAARDAVKRELDDAVQCFAEDAVASSILGLLQITKDVEKTVGFYHKAVRIRRLHDPTEDALIGTVLKVGRDNKFPIYRLDPARVGLCLLIQRKCETPVVQKFQDEALAPIQQRCPALADHIRRLLEVLKQ